MIKESASKKYHISDQLLGKGSFGVVFLAKDKKTNKEFAVKILKKATVTASAKIIEYFNAEKKVMTEICHPNLLHCYDIEEDDTNYYLYLQYCRSGTLTNLIQNKRPLTENQATFFLLQLLHGFRELHQRKIMHRDLKPDNILLDGNLLVIGDFGLVKEGTIAMTNVGSPVTQAPEVLLKRFTPGESSYYLNRVDIWSLGVCYYYMLAGKYPWSIRKLNELMDDVQNKSGYNLEFPPELSISEEAKYLLIRMIEKEPSKRISWDMIFSSDVFFKFFSNLQANDQECCSLVASIDERTWANLSKLFKPVGLGTSINPTMQSVQQPKQESLDRFKPIRTCIDDHRMLSENLLEFAKEARNLIKHPEVVSHKLFKGYISLAAVALSALAVALLESFENYLLRGVNFTSCLQPTWEDFLASQYCKSIYESTSTYRQNFQVIVNFYIDKARYETEMLEADYEQMLSEISLERDNTGVIAVDRLDSLIKKMVKIYMDKSLSTTGLAKNLRHFFYCCSSGLQKYKSVVVRSGKSEETNWVVWKKQLTNDEKAKELIKSAII